MSPAVGQTVRYSGAAWSITAVTADPVNLGSFVDLARQDDPTVTARVHSAQLAPDTTGGWTWQEQRPAPGNRGAGDPRYPVTNEFLAEHQRFSKMIDGVASDLFSRSRWADDTGWESLPETRRTQLRGLVRAAILNQPLPALPAGVTATQARNRVLALLPQDLKDWLVANPQ